VALMTETNEAYDAEEYEKLSRDVKYDTEKFKDPYVVGAMIHRLVEERRYTNALLRDINKKLNQLLENRAQEPDVGISEIDEEIIKLVEKLGTVTAEEVQAELKYKGRNAASARLNALEKKNLLKKTRKGKKVVFHK
jgi:predicted HTH transcriptional regulator